MIVADLNPEAVARLRRTGRKKLLPRRMASAVEVHAASIPSVQKLGRARCPMWQRSLDPLEEVYLALTLGVRDYVRKNGFARAVIGLSGGVDSALTAVLAVDALGADNVWGLFMPSPYTSKDSYDDVAELGNGLQSPFERFPSRRCSTTIGARSRRRLRGMRPIRRKRTSRPVSGAISSWPSPISSAIWC